MTKRFDDEFVRRGNPADSMTLGGLNDNAVKLGAGQNKKYTFRLTPASAVSYTHLVSGNFTNIETLNLNFTAGKAARVELYKSQLPSVSFTL